MRNKLRIFLITLFLCVMLAPLKAYAVDGIAAPSASFAAETVSPQQVDSRGQKIDTRAKVLQTYLHQKNSPLETIADVIIASADKNAIDWKLIPAISGVESGYCEAIPQNSFNCWGFGIYGNNVRRFQSWTEAVETVSSALRSDYMDKWHAKNVFDIGHIYAADPNWAFKVTRNMQELQDLSTTFEKNSLSISL